MFFQDCSQIPIKGLHPVRELAKDIVSFYTLSHLDRTVSPCHNEHLVMLVKVYIPISNNYLHNNAYYGISHMAQLPFATSSKPQRLLLSAPYHLVMPLNISDLKINQTNTLCSTTITRAAHVLQGHYLASINGM